MRDDGPMLEASASLAGAAQGCPCCAGSALREILAIRGAPTNSCILLGSPEEARAYPTGDISLVFCEGCGFVYNRAFNPLLTEYSSRYEETQAYSPTFNAFHQALAARLIDKYGLGGGTALEIGCGKGEFLSLLAEIGDVRGVGVDPGVHPERIAPQLADRLRFIPAFFAPEHIDRDFDMIGCKMTLEHIPRPFDFVDMIRRGVANRRVRVVFFQVPEAMRILRTHAFEDVYYEHCSYFTAGSLARLFRRAGFDILDIGVDYGEQYLTLEAAPAGHEAGAAHVAEDDLEELRAAADGFERGVARAIAGWKARLAAARTKGAKIAVWGSGSKAVAFLSAVDPEGAIDTVTDINPHRQGHFMPGSAQRIVAPSELQEIRPDLVIVMNRVYADEIASDLRAMDVNAEIAAL